MVLHPTLEPELLRAPDLRPTLWHLTATADPVAPIPPPPVMEELPMDLASHLHFRPIPDSQVVLQLLLRAKEVVEFRHRDLGLNLLVLARLTRTTVQMAMMTLTQEVDPMLRTPLDRLVVELPVLTPARMARTVLLSRA